MIDIHSSVGSVPEKIFPSEVFPGLHFIRFRSPQGKITLALDDEHILFLHSLTTRYIEAHEIVSSTE